MANSKLSNEQWEEIQKKYEAGQNVRELAQLYDITHGAIIQRAKREGWKLHGSATKLTLAGSGHWELGDSHREDVKVAYQNRVKLGRYLQEVGTKVARRVETGKMPVERQAVDLKRAAEAIQIGISLEDSALKDSEKRNPKGFYPAEEKRKAEWEARSKAKFQAEEAKRAPMREKLRAQGYSEREIEREIEKKRCDDLGLSYIDLDTPILI